MLTAFNHSYFFNLSKVKHNDIKIKIQCKNFHEQLTGTVAVNSIFQHKQKK